MGMRHPARPCMNRRKVPGGCGPDRRSPEQIASDPYDKNNPVSVADRAALRAGLVPPSVKNAKWDPRMGMRHPARPCMKTNSCDPDKRLPEYIARDPWCKNCPESVRERQVPGTYKLRGRELLKKLKRWCRQGVRWSHEIPENEWTCKGSQRYLQ